MIAFLSLSLGYFVSFGHPITLLRYTDKCIVSIMKTVHRQENMQLENKYDAEKHVDFIHVYFSEATGSMHRNLHRQC